MPRKNSTVDQLGTIKAKYDGARGTPIALDSHADTGRRDFLSPFAWIALAVLLAIISASSLMFSYIKLRSLAERESALAQKEERIKECDQRLSMLNVEIAKLAARQENLKKENMSLEADVVKRAESTASYRVYAVMVPSLKIEVDKLVSDIQSLKTEKGEIEGAVSKIQPTLDALRESYTNTQSRMDDTQRAFAAKKEELSAILASVSSKQAALAGLAQTVTEKDFALTALINDTDKKKKERDEHIRLRDEAQGIIPSIQDTIIRLQVERSSLTNEVTALASELARLNSRVSAERKAISNLDEEKTSLAAEVTHYSGMRAEIQQMTQQKELITKELAVLGQQLKTLQSAFTERTDAQAILQKQVSDLETKRIDLDRAVNQLIGQQKALTVKDSAVDK